MHGQQRTSRPGVQCGQVDLGGLAVAEHGARRRPRGGVESAIAEETQLLGARVAQQHIPEAVDHGDAGE